ncbi:hypothetical protein M3Y99_01752400 [Aphelenchoides fujianensis]|nr:hypothetical protein M3Y99_01752400 [Aphelenchoides fujianensis]
MLAALLREERLDDANLEALMQDANQTAVALRFFVAAVRGGRPIGPEVLQMGFGLLEVAEGILESTNERELFRQLKVDLVTRLYQSLSPEPQTSAERARTDFLVPQAVRLNVLDARAQASRTWTEFVRGCDQQAVEFALAYWTRLLEQFPVYTFFKQELNNVEAGLKCAEDPRLLNRLLQQAAAHDRQDLGMQIARNPAAADVSFEFARRLLQQLMSEFDHQLTSEQRNALVQVLESNINTRLSTIRDYTRFLFDVQVPQTPPVWSENEVKSPVRDVAYDLAFRPQLPAPHLEIEWGKEGTFDANSTISFVTTSPTDRIELNAHRQAIGRVVATIDGSTFPVRFERDFQRTLLTIFFGRQLPAGTAVRLTFEYAGFLSTPQSNGGVIVTKHFNSITKESSWALTIQLAAGAHPRTLVPCLDSSAFKAVWRVAIEHPLGTTAIANGAVRETRNTNRTGVLLTSFAPTTPTATLVFGLSVGRFEAIGGRTRGGVPVRFHAADRFQPFGRLALDFYGAMENQGAIVLRDTLLFFDEHTHGLEFKRAAFHSVTHQCAHQWFGDLLSNRRWTEMFLSESFAHFFEHQIYANLTGDHLVLRFASTEEGLLFDEDHVLPVVKETKSESSPFTTLIHNKVLSPAALFHSLQILMGRREFRAAVREYVAANQFGAVELDDLYAAFSQHANFSYETSHGSRSIGIRDFADRFLFQASFPVFVVNQTKNETIVSSL